MTWLVKIVIDLLGSKIAREAVAYGAKKLVESTDNGIDDKLIDIFLDEAVKSKRNSLHGEIKDIFMKNFRGK